MFERNDADIPAITSARTLTRKIRALSYPA
jgi:hypothetical protein